MPPKNLTIRQMQESDVSVGLRLGAQNGWNQLRADWMRFLAMQPDGCFMAELPGAGVGTAAGCIFDDVAWVALVLVDAEHRRQGIGSALMERVLQFLDEKKIPSIRLDATPLGQPIYEKLGFTAEYELVRYAGVLPERQEPASFPVLPPTFISEQLAPKFLPELIQFDRSICATNRKKFLTRFYQEVPHAFRIVRKAGEIIAYLCVRRGARAVQLGPCLGDADAALTLLRDACHRYADQSVYIDIPANNKVAVEFAESVGLTVQRHLLRMGSGKKVEEQMERLIASSGPEKG